MKGNLFKGSFKFNIKLFRLLLLLKTQNITQIRMKKFNIKYIHIPCESASESVTDSEDFRSGFESFEYDFQHI